MHQPKNIPYPKPMLNNVDYDNLDYFDMEHFALTDLEYNIAENCVDFLGQLEQVSLKSKMLQNPETVIFYLCCYLGTATTIYNQKNIKSLKPQINQLLNKHAKLSLSKFDHYLSGVNSDIQSLQIDKLMKDTPSTILFQTMRLGNIILDMTDNLSNNRNIKRNQKDLMLSHNELFTLLIPLVNEQSKQWKGILGDISINYAINQLVIQIGWLIGYFAYADRRLNINAYLEHGMPCISIYMHDIDNFLQVLLTKGRILTSQQSLNSTAKPIDTEEIGLLLHKTSLLQEIDELYKKTRVKTPPAMHELQEKMLIIKSDLENLTTDLIMDGIEVKIIYMSLFYFWFTLDAPLRGVSHKHFDKSSPFDEMTDIIRLIQKTTSKLPEPKFSRDLQMLNSKLESLKDYLSDPNNLDHISEEQIEYQNTNVNTAIHTLVSNYLKKDYHPEIIANILFYQWVSLSVFYDVSEQEWQKMDYYFLEILNAVRNYISTIIKK